METMETQKNAKKRQIFKCETCDFNCFKHSEYLRHLSTRKHHLSVNGNILDENGNKMETLETQKNAKPEFKCPCGKTYTTRGGLWKHQKTQKNAEKCQKTPICEEVVSEEDEMPVAIPSDYAVATNSSDEYLKMVIDTKDKMIEMQNDMINKQEDFINKQQNIIMEVNKNANQITNNNNTQNNNINNNHSNSHNKTFNLQFFLNDTCKDAMNITDFVNSLKLTLQDLEHVGEAGYAEGISRVFMRGLNDLDVEKRPIHCSDIKREVIHIKDQDKWEKDTTNQDKLKKAIKDVSTRNLMLLDNWRKEHPGCTNYNHIRNDMYLKMQIEALGPADSVAEKKDFGKIIKSIAKTTIIDKNFIMKENPRIE